MAFAFSNYEEVVIKFTVINSKLKQKLLRSNHGVNIYARQLMAVETGCYGVHAIGLKQPVGTKKAGSQPQRWLHTACISDTEIPLPYVKFTPWCGLTRATSALGTIKTLRA